MSPSAVVQPFGVGTLKDITGLADFLASQGINDCDSATGFGQLYYDVAVNWPMGQPLSAHSLPTFKKQAVRLGVHLKELVIDAFLVGSLMKGQAFVDDIAMWHYSDSGEWPVESCPELLAEVAVKYPASRQGFSPPSTPTSASSSLLDAAQDAGVFMSPDQSPSGSVNVESEDDCVLVRSVTTNHPPLVSLVTTSTTFGVT